MSVIYKNGTAYAGISQAAKMSTDVGNNTLNLQTTIQNILGDFAPIETNPVSNTYRYGDYLTFNGALYKTRASIPEGQPLIIGTNVKSTTVGEEISNISKNVENIGNVTSFTKWGQSSPSTGWQTVDTFTVPTGKWLLIGRLYASGSFTGIQQFAISDDNDATTFSNKFSGSSTNSITTSASTFFTLYSLDYVDLSYASNRNRYIRLYLQKGTGSISVARIDVKGIYFGPSTQDDLISGEESGGQING